MPPARLVLFAVVLAGAVPLAAGNGVGRPHPARARCELATKMEGALAKRGQAQDSLIPHAADALISDAAEEARRKTPCFQMRLIEARRKTP